MNCLEGETLSPANFVCRIAKTDTVVLQQKGISEQPATSRRRITARKRPVLESYFLARLHVVRAHQRTGKYRLENKSLGLQNNDTFVGMIVRTKKSPVTARFTGETIMTNRSVLKCPTGRVANIERAVNMITHNRRKHGKTCTWTPQVADSIDQTTAGQEKTKGGNEKRM